MQRQFSGKSGLTGTPADRLSVMTAGFPSMFMSFAPPPISSVSSSLTIFYEYLLRVERSITRAPMAFSLTRSVNSFGYLVVYVGIYQHAAYFLGRFSYLYLAYLVVALDYFAGRGPVFAQIFKHIPKCVFLLGMIFSNYKFSHFSCFR